MRLSAYDTFCLYLALKNHFSRDSYDFFKYNGKTHVNKETFLNRRDRLQFQRLSKRYDADQMRDFFIANFLHDESIWVGNLLDDNSDERYNEYMKRKQSLSYVFKNELDKILDDVNGDIKALFKPHDGTLPLLTAHYQHEASLETLAILDYFVDYFNRYDDRYKDDYMWSKTRKRCKKLFPFIEFDKNKMKELLKEKLNAPIYS